MSSSEENGIAIVGGGIMGLCVALRLSRRGMGPITVFERSQDIGGLSSSYSWEDVTWDRFYHVVLSSDVELQDFLFELGLSDRVFWKETRTGFYREGKLVSMSSIGDFIAFPFLTLWQKFRLGIGILLATRFDNLDKLDRIYVREWLKRLFGRRVYERLWEPLLRTKLGSAGGRSSAAFMSATIRRLYGARSGDQKVEKMGHVHGGYDTILDALFRRLADADVEIRTGEAVLAVRPLAAEVNGSVGTPARYELHTTCGMYRFNRVVMTVPCPEVLRITGADIHGKYWRDLARVEYLGVVCVLLILSRSLSPYYVINLLDTSLPFTGIIEATNIVPPSDVGGKYLVYLPKYCTADDAIHQQPDADVTNDFVARLKRIFPDLGDGDILHAAVFREAHVQPLQQIESLQHSFGFATPYPGLYVSNTAMIRNSTLNNNATLELARGVSERVVEDAAASEETVFHQSVRGAQ